MAISPGFHMIFAAVGMALPLMMLAAEWRWIHRQDRDALDLARLWTKLTAVLFASARRRWWRGLRPAPSR